MDRLSHTTTEMLDHAEEKILYCTPSDEAVEAAAGKVSVTFSVNMFTCD